MKSRRLTFYLGIILALLVAALVIGTMILQDASKSLALAKYRAIKTGMKPPEVEDLMRDGGDVQGGELGIAQVWHVDGRYMIGVVYGPSPNLPASATRPPRPCRMIGRRGRRLSSSWDAAGVPTAG